MTCFLSWVISFSFLFLPLNAFIILFSGVSLQGSRFGSFFHHACTSWALFISGGCFMPVVFWTWVLWGPLKPPAGLVKIQTARSQPKISETASLGWTPRICISSLIIVSMLSCLFSWPLFRKQYLDGSIFHVSWLFPYFPSFYPLTVHYEVIPSLQPFQWLLFVLLFPKHECHLLI